MRVVSSYKDKDYEQELFAELNRKYASGDADRGVSRRQRLRRLVIGLVALSLSLFFILSLVGRWLVQFTGPSFIFLKESWALSGDPVVDELKDAVVRVYVTSSAAIGGGEIRGSGFNLDENGLVVTNRHLVENADLVRVVFYGRGAYLVEEITVSAETDLALLRFAGENLPVIALAKEPAVPGDQLLIIGNPLNFFRIANRGELIGYRDLPGREVPQLIIEALVYPGSSGSPVFNQEGKVVGVIFATLPHPEPTEVKGLAIDLRELQSFLDDYHK